VSALEPYRYTVEAWVDRFGTWRRDLLKKIRAGVNEGVDLLVGAELVSEAAARARGADAEALVAWATTLTAWAGGEPPSGFESSLEEELVGLMDRYPGREDAVLHARELGVDVERERAASGAWYEMFPRSCSSKPGRHGTFKDCERRLRYVAEMGFDVVYLPPIHPIGLTHRKGKNNDPVAAPGDHGSPWAIGADGGGHKAVHPELGSLQDFRRFLGKAEAQGIEVALDLAFQCSPDHPYVSERPQWFRRRPDGSVQYAENPPKKYEDILPLDFECQDWRALWAELRSVVLFWVDQGVRIFRVDNPHTKPFRFWEWLIAEVRRDHPEVIFLAEAFTRPKIMYQLAKLGFTQSYTYFAWRHTKWELTEYFEELTEGPAREFMRPNVWPNTPDILTEYLQFGGRPAFMARLGLAATLAASYGIYGPAFELCEGRPKAFIARMNRIRRDNPALRSDRRLRFHPVDNEQIVAYSKTSEDLSNVILVVVNLDPHHRQAGWVEVSGEALGIGPHQTYQMHDLLTDARYFWSGTRNYVELDPAEAPVHVLRLRQQVRSEQDFDYFA